MNQKVHVTSNINCLIENVGLHSSQCHRQSCSQYTADVVKSQKSCKIETLLLETT